MWLLLEVVTNRLERFSVAIPTSVASDTPHLREKTAKLGSIARACSVFGVSEIIIYRDDVKRDQEADTKFSVEILRYLETPQYLRRRLFKLDPAFRFTGILPPLQTPPHSVPHQKSAVKVGDLREGVVVSRSGGGLMIDAGLEEQISAPGDRRAGERVTLRFVSVDGILQAEIADSPRVSGVDGNVRSLYWGYQVGSESSLGKLLKGSWDLKVGTSRFGDSVLEVLPSLSEALKHARSALVAFGSPKRGLTEILSTENLRPKDAFHYFLNTVPNQQTVTVRTEEALLISLGILNLAENLTL